MTSSANDEWDYYALLDGIAMLNYEIRYLKKLVGPNAEQVKNMGHTIDFIEYNMRELEIHESNGD